MASTTNFNTTNSTYRQLMGNGLTYRIPRFQRDYSWTEEEWEDLWLDIVGTMSEDGESAHYMGYLVLQTDDQRTFEVIDGQQRLTTLSLVVLAILKNIQRLVDGGVDAQDNTQRLETIRQSYIGYLDPVTLVPLSKLKLNRNNDQYYQTYLVPMTVLPQRGFRASEHSLRKAFEWFDGRVRDYLRDQRGDKGVALASFVVTMSDRLFFTVITVTDELNAYKVFETLNARGVRLSATDLLKNYLFSVLHRDGKHEHELKALEDRWQTIVERLGSERFPDFLRAHWNSRRSPVRQAELFKTIRASVADSQQVFSLMRDIEQDIDTYLALRQPDNAEWPADWKEQVVLLRTFGVRQPFPLLLAVKRQMDDAAFIRVLRASVIVSFRYNVIGNLSTGDQETVYNAVTRGVFERDYHESGDVVRALLRIYPSDEQFKAAFATKSIRTAGSGNSRIVRYILSKLERHLAHVEVDDTSNTLSIEHVLPQRPSDGRIEFPENETDTYVYRLGNMALLETGANRDLGNADYAAKRTVYARSAFATTRKLADENVEWTPERISNRQRWMAHQVTSIWRIDLPAAKRGA